MIKFFIFCFVLCFYSPPSDLVRMRDLFERMNRSEKEALYLEEQTLASKGISIELKQAYLAATHMALAKYNSNPFFKVNAFNEGKKNLEATIAADSSDCERRYIRLAIQQNAPNILAYNKSISKDKLFLLKQLTFLKKNDPDLFSRIYTYLVLRGNLSEKEKNMINTKV